jgi:hypothetical protein
VSLLAHLAKLLALVRQDSKLVWRISGVLPPLIMLAAGGHLAHQAWACSQILPHLVDSPVLALSLAAVATEAALLRGITQLQPLHYFRIMLAGTPLLGHALVMAGAGTVAAWLPMLQAGYLLAVGGQKMVRQVAEMIGERSIEQVSN